MSVIIKKTTTEGVTGQIVHYLVYTEKDQVFHSLEEVFVMLRQHFREYAKEEAEG